MIWTRVSADADSVPVSWKVARDRELKDVAVEGEATAEVGHDHTVHVDVAFRAREEWLPIRRPDPADPTRVFRQVSVGSLADLFLLDIRSRRDQPVVGAEMDHAGRSMLGEEQRRWLLGALDSSDADWRLVASPSVCSAPGARTPASSSSRRC